MITFKKVLEPQYYKEFQCIKSACYDNCCTGWDIVVDKATYDFYRQCDDTFSKHMFDKHITVNNNSTEDAGDISYAQIIMEDNVCPFLSEDKLCTIQKTMNEESLSITCDTYPRVFNNVDGVLERSLYLSCPASAELILLNKKQIEFDEREDSFVLRSKQIPTLYSDMYANIKPYRYFHEIRIFIISLLQDRSYPLWQRLVILSVFCERLDQVLPKHYDEDILYLIEHFENKIQNGEFRKAMNNAGSRTETQLHITKILIDHRLKSNIVDEKFSDHVNKFKKGIGDTKETSPEIVTLGYAEAYSTYYQPFIEKHEYILENYLVNYVFKNLFPLGAQKSINFEQKSIYTEYILLTIHFSLIKTLLIGIAGYYKDDFNIEHVVTFIQTFAKSIEHNMPFQKQAIQFIEAANMNNTAGMTILNKN